MKRYSITSMVVVLLAVILLLVYLWRGEDDRYNLLLITLDTTRADHLGCYGYADATTPALDTIADTGVKFTRAFCNVPLTLPSHVTIMTGLYPPEHGCRVNGTHELSEGLTTLADLFASHGYQTAAFVAAFVLDSKFGLNRGFQIYDEHDVPDEDGIPELYSYRPADKVTDATLSWFRKRSGRPFFCWVHYFDPHLPYHKNPLSWRYRDNPYDAEIAFMDSQIGRLIDYLKKRGLLKKTIIMVVGDHGEGLGEHGEVGHGLFLYNSTMHVPLMVSSPGKFPSGREVATLVSTVDLFPTILDIFGWKVPGHISGRSFTGALSGGTVPDRPFYGETEFPLTEYGWSPLQSVTTSAWKHIRAPREELYDLQSDPGELDNLVKKRPDKEKQLQGLLSSLEGEMVKVESSEVKLDELSRKTLESLGYLGGGGGSRGKEHAELRDPKDAVWMRQAFMKALKDARRGRTAEAKKTLRKLIKESPESYAFRFKLANILRDQGDFKGALRELEELVKMDPEEYGTHYNLGKTLMKLGEYDRAIDEFRVALGFDPEQTAGYNDLGVALLRTRQVREAMDAFRKSISLDTNQCDPHYNLGLVLMIQGRYEEAAEEFRQAVRLRPDFAEARRELGVVLTRSGQVAEGLNENSRVE